MQHGVPCIRGSAHRCHGHRGSGSLGDHEGEKGVEDGEADIRDELGGAEGAPVEVRRGGVRGDALGGEERRVHDAGGARERRDEVVYDEGDRGREIIGRENARRGGHNEGGAGEDDDTLPWEGGWGKREGPPWPG